MRTQILELSKWNGSRSPGRLAMLLLLAGLSAQGLVSCARHQQETSGAGRTDAPANGMAQRKRCKAGLPRDSVTIDLGSSHANPDNVCVKHNATVTFRSVTNTDLKLCFANSNSPFNPLADGGVSTAVVVKAGKRSEQMRIKPDAGQGDYTYSTNCPNSPDEQTHNGTLEVATGETPRAN